MPRRIVEENGVLLLAEEGPPEPFGYRDVSVYTLAQGYPKTRAGLRAAILADKLRRFRRSR